MKKFICAFLVCALFVSCAAFAESIFSGAHCSLTLPADILPLEETECYTSAAIADYGPEAETDLIASNDDLSKVIVVTSTVSDVPAKDAAIRAAGAVSVSDADLIESEYGSNVFTVFSCEINGTNCTVCYTATNGILYCVTCSGLTEDEITDVLSSFSAN